MDVDEQSICLAGTIEGLDTAVSIKPATSSLAWYSEIGLRVL